MGNKTILIIAQNKGRGSGIVVRQQASYLTTQNHKIIVMYPDNQHSETELININIGLHTNIIPVHEYLTTEKNQKPVHSMSEREAFEYIIDYENALEEAVKQHTPNLIIAHHANISTVAACKVARKYDIPYIVFIHGTGVEPRFGELFDTKYDDAVWAKIKEAVEFSNGIIVTTNYVLQKLVKPMFDLEKKPVLVQPLPIDLTEKGYNPSNTVKEVPSVDKEGKVKKIHKLPKGYVVSPSGSLTEAKGFPNIIKAAPHFLDIVPLFITGDGPLRTKYEKLIEQDPQLKNKIHILGYISSKFKAGLINGALLSIFAPNKNEHYGIAITESLGGGTPVVAYHGGGVDSIVTKDLGILTEKNPNDLGKSIRGLLQDNDKLNRMSKKARLAAEKRFNVEILGPQFESFLLNIINEEVKRKL